MGWGKLWELNVLQCLRSSALASQARGLLSLPGCT